MSGADVASVCQRAALAAVRRVIAAAGDAAPDETALHITAGDLLAALDEVLAPGTERAGRRARGAAP